MEYAAREPASNRTSPSTRSRNAATTPGTVGARSVRDSVITLLSADQYPNTAAVPIAERCMRLCM